MSSLVRSLFVPLSFLLFISLSDCVSLGQDLLGDDDASDTEVVEKPEATPTPTVVPEESPQSYLPNPYVIPDPDAATEPDHEDEDPIDEPAVSESDLEALLISLTDLPPNWTDVTIGEIPTDLPGVDEVDGTLVSGFYQRSDLGPYFAHMILYTEDEADAEQAFDLIYEELDDPEILDDITDQVRSWETAEANIEGYGDDAFAFAAIGDTGLVPVEADMVGVRVGQHVSFVIHAQLVEIDSDLTIELVEIALDRINEDNDESAVLEAPFTPRDIMSHLRWR